MGEDDKILKKQTLIGSVKEKKKQQNVEHQTESRQPKTPTQNANEKITKKRSPAFKALKKFIYNANSHQSKINLEKNLSVIHCPTDAYLMAFIPYGISSWQVAAF